MDLNNWCVKVTNKNRDILQSYITSSGWRWSIGSYYGIKNGYEHGNDNYWGTVLTFEEFQEKFINEDKDPNYEIY